MKCLYCPSDKHQALRPLPAYTTPQHLVKQSPQQLLPLHLVSRTVILESVGLVGILRPGMVVDSPADTVFLFPRLKKTKSMMG